MSNNTIKLDDYGDLLMVDDVMKVLRLGRNNTLQLLKDGKIKSLRLGRTYRVPKKYLAEFIYGNEVEAQEA